MAFYFGSKLKVMIEGAEYTVDVANKKVIDAVKKIANKSNELANSKKHEEKDIEKYIKELINFIDIITDGKTQTIFEGREITIEDLTDLVNYLLTQITEFKVNRLQRLSKENEK